MITKEFEHSFENPFFVATVVDNNDSTFNYRLKVRIDHLHDAVKDEDLPWAGKLDSSFMGMDGSHSLHSVPEVGSKVLVIAIANDPNSLLYMGCLYKKSDSTPSGNNYLDTYGIYNKNGEYIKLDKVQKLLELVWAGKININKITEMNITVSGNVNLTVSGNVTTKTSSNFVVNASSNINATASSNVSLKSSGPTNIEAGGPVTIKSTGLTNLMGGQVMIEKATVNGFTCLDKCILTNAPHVTNLSVG